jgi:hypothetical protein
MRSLATLCAASLVLAPGVAQAAQQQCLTPAEASSLAAYALPAAITGTTKRCAPSLAADAFLPRGGAELASRYAVRKAQNWPAAKAAFFKIGGGAKDESSAILKTLPDPSLQQMLDAIIEGMVAQEIPIEKCGKIDQIIGLLAPLPAQNTADLIAVVVGLAGKSGKVQSDKFAICKT